jgi:hypothetical protein
MLMARILAYALVVPVLTWTRPSSWERFAGAGASGGSPAGLDAIHRTADYVDAVLIAFRPLVRPGCLVRGMTMYHFLRKAGADVSLAFGVGRLGDDFRGHCWLVKDGGPFLEPGRPDLEYTETFRLPLTEAGATGV